MKAKEKFWQWYLQPEQKKRFKVDSLINGTDNVLKVRFLALSDAEKWGVYLEFFDSEGIQIYIKPTSEMEWSIYIDNFGHHLMTEYSYHPTRQQAQTEAINKAFKILEERLF